MSSYQGKTCLKILSDMGLYLCYEPLSFAKSRCQHRCLLAASCGRSLIDRPAASRMATLLDTCNCCQSTSYSVVLHTISRCKSRRGGVGVFVRTQHGTSNLALFPQFTSASTAPTFRSVPWSQADFLPGKVEGYIHCMYHGYGDGRSRSDCVFIGRLKLLSDLTSHCDSSPYHLVGEHRHLTFSRRFEQSTPDLLGVCRGNLSSVD